VARGIASAVQDFLNGGDLDEDSASDTEQAPEAAPVGTASGGTSPAMPTAPAQSGAAPGGQCADTSELGPVTAAVTSNPAASPPVVAGRAAGGRVLSPGRAQDFLQVLRKRALPPKVAEKQKELTSLARACVLGLYRDRVRPVHKLVEERVLKRHDAGRADGELCARYLTQLCAKADGLFDVVPGTTADQHLIFLVEEPSWFASWADVEKSVGDFGHEVWRTFAAFLARERGPFPGQPFQAALELLRRGARDGLPAGLLLLSLPELEHLIRLAAGPRGLLCRRGKELWAASPPRLVEGGETSGAKDRCPRPAAAPGLCGAVDAAGGERLQEGEDLAGVLLHLSRRFPHGTRLRALRQHLRSACAAAQLGEEAYASASLANVFEPGVVKDLFPSEDQDTATPPR